MLVLEIRRWRKLEVTNEFAVRIQCENREEAAQMREWLGAHSSWQRLVYVRAQDELEAMSKIMKELEQVGLQL